MKVALFTDTYLPEVNGVARTLGRWVNWLDARGHSYKLFAPTHEQMQEAADRGMVERLTSIPFFLYKDLRWTFANPLHIKRALNEFQPDIIHVATPFNVGLYGIHYAKKHNVPLVASYHTHFDQYLSYYKIQWLLPTLWKYMRWFHRDASKIYVPSRSTLEHLAHKGFTNLEIWGRGIDTQFYRPMPNREEALASYGIDSSKFIILYVGRLAPEKNVDIALEAYRTLPAEIKERSCFVMAGDGPLYKELSEQQGIQPDGGELRMLGFVQGDALRDLYSAGDVFFFPSTTETFGNVVLEAMASNTPVIGAMAGGVRDNIHHMKTGLLCEPNSVVSFRDALQLVYENDALRQQLADAGRDYAMTRSWDSIFSGLFDSYQEVLQYRKCLALV